MSNNFFATLMFLSACLSLSATAADQPMPVTTAVFSASTSEGVECIQVSIGNCQIRMSECEITHPKFASATVKPVNGVVEIRAGQSVINGKRIEINLMH